jgi:hypothetical protein
VTGELVEESEERDGVSGTGAASMVVEEPGEFVSG